MHKTHDVKNEMRYEMEAWAATLGWLGRIGSGDPLWERRCSLVLACCLDLLSSLKLKK